MRHTVTDIALILSFLLLGLGYSLYDEANAGPNGECLICRMNHLKAVLKGQGVPVISWLRVLKVIRQARSRHFLLKQINVRPFDHTPSFTRREMESTGVS